MKKTDNYYIGLDIGTDSIGWAVTDPEYKILKFNNNAQWGIRLLEESQTAQDRRLYRTARRRTARNRFRMQCLEMLFNEEIAKLDVAFFQRLHESNLYLEDKSVKGKYSLFNDPGFTDKDYHKAYPTVYHLRKRLLESTEPADVRIVYLAISHIIKNRGHFLFDSDSLGSNTMPVFEDVWHDLTVHLHDALDIRMDCRNLNEVRNLLKNRSMTVTAKKKELLQLFAIDKSAKAAIAAITLLSGGTASTSDLFSDEALKSSEAAKIVFSGSFDDKAATYEAALGDRFETLEYLKAVYDWAILADILNSHSYISYAKCDIYDKHKRDLRTLKTYVKSYMPQKYNLIFNENAKDTCNYLAYSGKCTKGAVIKKCNQQDFLDFLKKQLPEKNTKPRYNLMFSEIAAGTFMPKIVSIDNAVIPMQVNRAELIAILKNAATYLPFLNRTDESGKSVSDKILDVFSFRIPYYVGPLNKHSDKAWLERTDEKIYPWNFSRVVNIDRSAEKFIENLTSKCTYLFSADVLPKNSLLYSKFTLLNELNNLKIDGCKISVSLKQNIWTDLFEQNNKISAARLAKYLKSRGIEGTVTGIDGDFKNSLKSFRDLQPYPLSEQDKEEIIKAITIFGDDKALLRKHLHARFGSKLSKEEITQLSKLKYAGWGRLSREFLSELEGVCIQTGEVNSIIDFMWQTNNNLMQLLSNEFSFLSAIEQANGDRTFTTLRREIDALYVSPKIKRPIYQTMQIVEELIKINGAPPKKIFIEVARGEEEKKRTVSRKARLLNLYKACKSQSEELYASIEKTDEDEFRRDALYLYYTQQGRCAYTEKPIPLEDLYNRNLYDIDHIFPRSKIKDDSLDNRVLVTKSANETKGNAYPVAQDIRTARLAFWTRLRNLDLISQKKFDRLTRSTPLTDEELTAFISRQLVETRQSSKAVAQLLAKRYDSEIVYVKAGLVSDFRKKFDFVKCREVNDLHHAKDAYLNIVVGNVFNTRFNHSRAAFIADLQAGHVSLNKMFEYNTPHAWSVNPNSPSIVTVKKTLGKNNIRFTRYAYKQKGGLFKQTIMKKGGGQVPIKAGSPRNDISKYGGYDSATATCFALVSYANQKGVTVKQFFPINLYEEHLYQKNPKAFLDEKYGIDATILIPCVKYNTLVSIDGFRLHISSKNSGGEGFIYKPAMQLVLDPTLEAYIKKIVRYLNKCAELRKEKPITPRDEISSEENLALYDALLYKLTQTVLKVKFSGTADILNKKKSIFKKLSCKEQCEILMQILSITHANVRSGDLSLLGAPKQSGTVTGSCKISPAKNIKSFKIIHQSVTGLFEQETELLDR